MTVLTSATDERTLQEEIARRRTFAIISHPDAGKTTLTEKLLLYAGAVDLAGAVRGRKSQRHATSDWMAMERERGISITSTALQFDYGGYRLNLLDTPGHQDFSEDTYRTLMAVDSAIMVLDGAKGIEPQTLKLFEVCRMRRIPIITFINKLDHLECDALGLLDEIERVLQISAVPMNWPIGSGAQFQGVYDLYGQQVLIFTPTSHGQHRAPVQVASLHDQALRELLGVAAHQRLSDEATLLEGAGATFDGAAFLAGDQTPVFFGSALNNFGVEPFLAALTQLAPPPAPRQSDRGEVPPDSEEFSGFVFKIQANMDPNHRDCLAFLRICSGRFTKDMQVFHPRLGRSIRMSRPHRLFARERETIETAFPGDVIGLTNPGIFQIGDTVCTGQPRTFAAVPRFAPESFATLINEQVTKQKQFLKGLEQLEAEGVIQTFYALDRIRREPIVAVVGELQFDVVQARMQTEYGVATRLERLPYSSARWVQATAEQLARVNWPLHSQPVRDRDDQLVALFQSDWVREYCQRNMPQVTFSAHPVG
ncbi:MAG: peptide chain release factor 3 [Roseiflexaceae bacterium]